MNFSYVLIFLFLVFFEIGNLKGQTTALDSLSRNATDPTAIVWQFQLEEYWTPIMSDHKSKQNTLRLRAVVPIVGHNKKKWVQLFRTTFNVKNYSSSTVGWSDLELFDLIIPRKYKWGAWGLGPLLSLPTANDSQYGSGKFSIGVAQALSVNNSKMGNWQLDILVEYLRSIAGEEIREEVNQFYVQPSLTYHLKKGLYIETEPVWFYSFATETLNIPLNFRLGKVWIIKKQKLNTYIEPETTIYSNASIYSKFGIRFGLRLLFKE